MIRDLSMAGEGITESRAQVCLVGGGIAGIFLGRLLGRRGVDVVVLEEGNATARTPAEADHRCRQLGTPYRGADTGRCFGLGGTSALWGGQMLPLAPSDFGDRTHAGIGAWPMPHRALDAYWPVVGDELGLRQGIDGEDRLLSRYPELRQLSERFELRLSEWLPFKSRNLARAFSASLQGDERPVIWLNAALVGMKAGESPQGMAVDSIAARSQNGRQLIVRAPIVVICAGALESTRILLEFDESHAGALSHGGAPLGRYFGDHLSATCGRFVCRDWRRFSLAVSPSFQHGRMRTPRLEFAAAAQVEWGLPSAFAHFTFLTRADSGFGLVRRVLRRRQGENVALGLTPSVLAGAVTDITSMAFWRIVHQRLWIPRQANLRLQVDVEQRPNSASRVLLSDEFDALGRRRLALDWRIDTQDLRCVHEVARMLAAAWQNSPLRAIAELQLTLPEHVGAFDSLYDVYHPTGTLRMGNAPSNSVVDADLRLWGVENCYVTSTAVFPSAGSANPGLTHLALTARLADRIVAQLSTRAPQVQ